MGVPPARGSGVRVIAGEARGFPLKCPADAGIRPTPDRVREALFSIIGPHVPRATLLDLYAGCGAIAIEALSRGAVAAVLVERSREALAAIRVNLDRCRLAERARIVAAPVLAALRDGRAGAGHTIVYVDPPYDSGEDRRVLEWLGTAEGEAVAPGLVIVEHRRKNRLPDSAGSLASTRTAVYGDTALTFYERPARPPAATDSDETRRPRLTRLLPRPGGPVAFRLC